MTLTRSNAESPAPTPPPSCSPDETQRVHAHLRALVRDAAGAEASAACRLVVR
jgi:hypothetical protein